MALINCPECGRQISDKAVTCPGCGYVLHKEQVAIERNTPVAVKQGKVLKSSVLLVGVALFILVTTAVIMYKYNKSTTVSVSDKPMSHTNYDSEESLKAFANGTWVNTWPDGKICNIVFIDGDNLERWSYGPDGPDANNTNYTITSKGTIEWNHYTGTLTVGKDVFVLEFYFGEPYLDDGNYTYKKEKD